MPSVGRAFIADGVIYDADLVPDADGQWPTPEPGSFCVAVVSAAKP